MSSIHVLIVDDHPVVREGARVLLGCSEEFRVVADVATARDARQALAWGGIHVVLLDLELGADDGLDLIPAVTAAGAKALVMTCSRRRETHLRTLERGAQGLVVKDGSPHHLTRALRAVHLGELWFERGVLDAAMSTAARNGRGTAAPARVDRQIPSLSPGEQQMLALVGEDLPNEQIAARLRVAEKTVRSRLQALLCKLGVGDRVELLAFAYQHGLARPPAR